MTPDSGHIPGLRGKAHQPIAANDQAGLIRIALGATDPGQVIINGPDLDLNALVRGKPVATGAALAPLLFAVCPHAHTAAYLYAIETAMDVTISDNQLLGRKLLVHAETLAALVWRHALAWPQLAGLKPDLKALKEARHLADAIARDLFPTDWRRIGGIDPEPDAVNNCHLFSRLKDILRHSLETSERCLDQCPPHQMSALPTDTIEETPLRHATTNRGPRPLFDWFTAQRFYARLRLDESLADITDTDRQKMRLALVDTARGHLRHHVTVSGSNMETWSASAPTDINFAPAGAAAQQLAGVCDPITAHWIIAAFDSCRPVSFEGHPPEDLSAPIKGQHSESLNA